MVVLKEMVFETEMTSKGQVQIFKEVRQKLGLSKRQRFFEKIDGKRVVLEPVPNLALLGGVLKEMGKNKKIAQLVKETKEGWD